MLPLHSDPGDPDVTIVAEFRTDYIYDFDGTDSTRRPHILKTGIFDYPGSTATDASLDSASLNERYVAWASALKITVDA